MKKNYNIIPAALFLFFGCIYLCYVLLPGLSLIAGHAPLYLFIFSTILFLFTLVDRKSTFSIRNVVVVTVTLTFVIFYTYGIVERAIIDSNQNKYYECVDAILQTNNRQTNAEVISYNKDLAGCFDKKHLKYSFVHRDWGYLQFNEPVLSAPSDLPEPLSTLIDGKVWHLNIQ